MQQFRDRELRLIFAALYAVALILVAYAHKPISLDLSTGTVPQAELAAYALPDGSVPVICLNGSSSGDGPTVGGAFCDACLITAAAGLLVSQVPALDVPALDRDPPEFPFTNQAYSSAPPRAHAPRGPPVVTDTIA